jgi:DNA-binding NarL/FixJ family response regulator
LKKIIIVDDNQLLRENLTTRLQDHFEITYSTGDAEELLEYLQLTDQSEWPALILMDIEMDGMDGITATAKLKTEYPQIKVAMLTVFEQEEKVWQSILAGADGYILKDEPKERLLMAMDDILQGGAFMSASIALKAMKLMKQFSPALQQDETTLQLTSREYEILELIAQGFAYKQIADKIFISVFTAKTHIHHIYEKLQVKNKTEAAMKLRHVTLKPNLR